MLSLLLPRRRTAARRPYVHRPALELLEARNAPSSLDPTSSLTSSDTLSSQDPVPAATYTTSGSTSSTTTPTPATPPAPQPGSLLDAVLTAPVAVATTSASTSGSDGTTTSGRPLVSAPGTAPVIDGCSSAQDSTTLITISGHVTDANPTSVTVTITSDWSPVNGQSTTADAKGNFSITLVVPCCTSATNSTHSATAVATNGSGLTSAPYTFMIYQQPSP